MVNVNKITEVVIREGDIVTIDASVTDLSTDDEL